MNRRFICESPRSGLLEVGVKSGTLLFFGTREGGSYSGTAYIFSTACGRAEYQVSGTVSDDQRQVVLYGKAPRKNERCEIIGYVDDTLVFTYQGP